MFATTTTTTTTRDLPVTKTDTNDGRCVVAFKILLRARRRTGERDEKKCVTRRVGRAGM